MILDGVGVQLMTMKLIFCLALLMVSVGCGRPAVNSQPPQVALVSAQQLLSLVAESTNSVTMLHFWATWCSPCVEEFPDVMTLADTYRQRGLKVILVSADAEKDLDAVNRFLSDHHVKEKTYMASNLNDDFIKTISTNWSGGIPASFYYTHGATPVEWHEGPRPFATHEQTVLKMLNQQHNGGMVR